MEDWCQVKVGIFCRGLVSGQGRWPTVKDRCQVMAQWRTGVRLWQLIYRGGPVSGQRTCFSVVDWCQVKVCVLFCIANKLKKVFPSLINEDQTGSNRYMGDNIRLIYDLIHYLNCNNLPGLLICIDFEKAFDSVDWNVMEGFWIWSNNMSVDLYILRQN